jgi:hypothetical protein
MGFWVISAWYEEVDVTAAAGDAAIACNER